MKKPGSHASIHLGPLLRLTTAGYHASRPLTSSTASRENDPGAFSLASALASATAAWARAKGQAARKAQPARSAAPRCRAERSVPRAPRDSWTAAPGTEETARQRDRCPAHCPRLLLDGCDLRLLLLFGPPEFRRLRQLGLAAAVCAGRGASSCCRTSCAVRFARRRASQAEHSRALKGGGQLSSAAYLQVLLQMVQNLAQHAWAALQGCQKLSRLL